MTFGIGILDFYKVISPNQRIWKVIAIPAEINVCEAFDGVGCQLEELYVSRCDGQTFFQCLAASNQAQNIQILTLVNTNTGTLHALKSLMVLTTLNLTFCGQDDFSMVNLVDYLNECLPTVKNLVIDCHDVEINLAEIQLNSIEALDINCHGLTRDLGSLISASFPKLTRLKLTASALAENVDITMQNLPTQSEIHINESWNYGFSFKSPSQLGPGFYHCYGKKKEYASYDIIKDLAILTFTTFAKGKLDLSKTIRFSSE